MSLAKVLFVDDEVPYVEALTKRLIKRDLEIIPAYRGDEALKTLAEVAPRLLVLYGQAEARELLFLRPHDGITMNRDRLLAASSPTGPAFEGAQMSCGQRAAPGRGSAYWNVVSASQLHWTADDHIVFLSASGSASKHYAPIAVAMERAVRDTIEDKNLLMFQFALCDWEPSAWGQ